MRPVPVLYLASYTLSLLGNSIAAVVFPLIVLQLTGSLMSTGILVAATALPAFLAGLFAGVVIDRVNRRTSSVVADLISAASIAALPLVDLITGLDLGWFILFGIIGAFGDVPGMTAREAMLPAIVRHSTLTAERLIGLRESLSALVIIVGPAAAGTLMVLFEGTTVLWITAGTSLAAALLTVLIPRRVGAQLPAGAPGHPDASAVLSVWAQLMAGWRVLFRSNRSLRAVTLLSLAMVAVLTALQGMLLPAHFAFIAQPGLLGFVLTAIAAGTIVGGGLYAVFGARGRRRSWFAVGLTGTVAGIGTVAVLPALPVLFAGAFLFGFSSGLFGSLIGVLMLEGIPERMRGRIMGTQNSLMMIAAPVGMVAVALLGEQFGLRTAGACVAAVWLVAAILALAAPALRTLEAPAPAAEKEGTLVDEKP
ncbi:MFS transporter [Cryobacterium soli]|uniref:MFS transporter n=1 Tax=Cryobacterium soli TaxID=2220095 RepID=UPI000E7635FE|nr:MFS transporter [Cryobacterium soli]